MVQMYVGTQNNVVIPLLQSSKEMLKTNN